MPQMNFFMLSYNSQTMADSGAIDIMRAVIPAQNPLQPSRSHIPFATLAAERFAPPWAAAITCSIIAALPWQSPHT